MAGLNFDEKNGRWRIQFTAPDGRRRSFSLKGTKKSDSRAQTIRGRIEELLQAKITGTAVSRPTASWLVEVDDDMYQQLADAGLVAPRAACLLGPFLEQWMQERSNEKESTRITWGNVQRNLLKFFGADKPLREITEADAERFVRWLKVNEELSDNTVRKRSSIAKQFFRSAVRDKLIEASPFNVVKGSMSPNRKRQRFVSEADACKVLAACPDAEFKLIFALSRWGALRCPSEVMALKWDDVDWKNGVLHVHATKTEHHEHGGNRVVPIFVELQPLLKAVQNQAKPSDRFVITQHRTHSNLGIKLARVIRSAGLTPWPKIWQNLRASRCTELQRSFPNHVTVSWCGHTQGIAEESYWMTTDADFRKATTEKVTSTAEFGANLVQQAVATGGNSSLSFTSTNEKSSEKPSFATHCELSRIEKVGDEGLEPPTSSL